MTASARALVAAVVFVTLLTSACGGLERVELGLDRRQAGETFGLVNRTDTAWSQVTVRVTGDAAPGACFDDVVAGWGPGETRSFPRCGDRTLVTLTVGGQEASFVVASGKLYRKLGRREVPVRP